MLYVCISKRALRYCAVTSTVSSKVVNGILIRVAPTQQHVPP